MKKIYIPDYNTGEFESFKDAYWQLTHRRRWCEFVMQDLVEFNVFYRDLLREKGLDAVKEYMLNEVPELAASMNLFDRLEKECMKGHFLADYDIQCCNIHDAITIMGHTFNGLEDVKMHTTICASPSMGKLDVCSRGHITPYPDVKVAMLDKSYPTFDSFDDCDGRSYQNYFFRKEDFSKEDVLELGHLTHEMDYCMVHEEIPAEFLPVVYYKGEGDYLLLASPK